MSPTFVEGASSHSLLATVNNCNNLKILYYNARSILPKHDELRLVVEVHNPDIVCIVETWLSPDILDSEISLSGYQVHRRDRNRHGGGILVYVRDHYVSSLLPTPDNLELLTLSISSGINRVCLSLLYRPPNSPSDLFQDLFLYLQGLDTTHFSNYILLGDFNVNFCNPKHPLYLNLYNIFSSFGLTQVVSEPTHTCSNGNTSLIDLIAMSSPSLLQSCVTVPPLCNSDHLGLLLHSHWRHSKPSADCSARTIWLYEHADWPRVRDLIEETEWSSLTTDDVDISWENWQQRFLEIMKECIPQKVLPPRRNLPWLNKNLVQLMRKRNMLFSRAKRSCRNSDFEKYKRMRNRVVSQLCEAKSRFFNTINPHNAKKFWKAVKYLNKTHNSIPVLCDGNSEARSDGDKAEMLGDFFTKCFNQAVPPLSPSNSTLNSEHTIPDDLLCTEEEVHFFLTNLDTSKATGPDGISACMLKSTADSVTPSVTTLLNLSLRTGQLPKEWKRSSVVPVLKKSPATSPNNYRPISLLSIVSKVLERHVHSLVMDHLHNHHPLAESQWGFQSGKSTVAALLTTTHSWLTTLEEGKEIGAVFFDLQKAFDSVPHQCLIEKLRQTGLTEHIISWILNYLTCREQRVVVNGKSSQYVPVISGVPQGSVLGPLLFLVYIDGLAQLPLSSGAQMVLYADDLLLFRTVSGKEDYLHLQNDISIVENWVAHNHLTLNANKCKYMVVSRKRSPTLPSNLTLGDSDLERVECFKYLGILLSNNLSFSEHIQATCTKARKILGLLYRRFYNNTDGATLLPLYLMMVRPHLEYASPVWNPHMHKDVTLLQNVEKFAFRMITKRWDSGYQELLDMVAIPSLEKRRLQSSLCMLYKIVHNLCHFPPYVITPRSNVSKRTDRPLLLHQPFASTNALMYSFVPRTVNVWNSLPQEIVTLPFRSFKNSVVQYL